LGEFFEVLVVKCNVAKLSGQMLLASLVVSLPLLSGLSACAQDFSDPATIIMMNAQRRGLIPGTQGVPVGRPASRAAVESTGSSGDSPFTVVPGRSGFGGSSAGGAEESPFAQSTGIAPSGGFPTTVNQAPSGMSAQQVFDRGCDKTAVGNFAQAIKDYDEAIKIDPNFGKAYANRGSARYNTGDHKGALADFDVAARLMPENQAVSALRDQIRNSLK
jgi:hypothetical protein